VGTSTPSGVMRKSLSVAAAGRTAESNARPGLFLSGAFFFSVCAGFSASLNVSTEVPAVAQSTPAPSAKNPLHNNAHNINNTRPVHLMHVTSSNYQFGFSTPLPMIIQRCVHSDTEKQLQLSSQHL
jgi:hypothetical protein